MTYSTRSKRSGTNRPQVRAYHYVNIDRQILVLHQAMAEKVLACPHLQTQVIAIIEQRYANGQLRHGGYLLWSCLLENIDDKQAFLAGVLADTPQMQKLRRRTPFIGILTENERQAALNEQGIKA
ncbi:MAG: hypothetical protein ACI8R9_000426 [Paraglaciecola sp.]|jgi:hypothetical protein